MGAEDRHLLLLPTLALKEADGTMFHPLSRPGPERPISGPNLWSMTMKKLSVFAALAFSTFAVAAPPIQDAAAARADAEKMLGFVPEYLKAVPDFVLPSAWEEMKALEISGSTALPCKVKELIGIAVSAQIPCRACAYGHGKIARVGGATEQEIQEAVAISSLSRHWSTFFNGMQLDEARFRADIKQVSDGAKKAMAAGIAPPPPMALVDAKSALKDIEQSFGLVPEFAAKFPEAALPGAWREMREIELNPKTALSGKYKNLISLAVAAQIPCKYCLIADTEFARLEGATDQEISEAVAMGGLVRHWATLLEGLQFDEAAYKRDFDRIAKALSGWAPKTAKTN
jgi:AhpD family alkylhydroperoxidase